jgi:predicted nucleic acid-binding protein
MIVVADTTPLNYLILIGYIELLPALYRSVLIPQEVHRELQRPGTPQAVLAWACSLPGWCEVRLLVSSPDPTLRELDPGEREAIQLALEAGLDTLLMDESEGRREALRRHLRVTGTVAVLEKAAQYGLINFRTALQRFKRTSGSLPKFETSLSRETHKRLSAVRYWQTSNAPD